MRLEMENGELIDPTNTTGLHYTNWAAKPGVPLEPNNLGGSEDHLAIGRYSDFIGWNDEGSDLTASGVTSSSTATGWPPSPPPSARRPARDATRRVV